MPKIQNEYIVDCYLPLMLLSVVHRRAFVVFLLFFYLLLCLCGQLKSSSDLVWIENRDIMRSIETQHEWIRCSGVYAPNNIKYTIIYSTPSCDCRDIFPAKCSLIILIAIFIIFKKKPKQCKSLLPNWTINRMKKKTNATENACSTEASIIKITQRNRRQKLLIFCDEFQRNQPCPTNEWVFA